MIPAEARVKSRLMVFGLQESNCIALGLVIEDEKKASRKGAKLAK